MIISNIFTIEQAPASGRDVAVVSPTKKPKQEEVGSSRASNLAAMKKAVPTPGRSYLRVLVFPVLSSNHQQKALFALDFLNKDHECHWMMKCELIPTIVENANPPIQNEILHSLKWCRVRETPFGDGVTPLKNSRNWDVYSLYGFLPLGKFFHSTLEQRAKDAALAFKNLFEDKNFKFYYENLLQETYPGVFDYYKKKFELITHMKVANIRMEERLSLDAHFLDEEIPKIMAELFPSISHNDFTEDMIALTSASRELPVTFDQPDAE